MRVGQPIGLLVALFLVSFGSPAAQIEIRSDISYGLGPSEMVDVCVPVGAGVARPGVILLHGGGWTSGTRKSLQGMCRDFAYQGVVAAAIDYRLAIMPANKWPAQLQDAQLAVRWLKRQAPELGLDPEHVCAWGASAGAHLAVFLAATHGTLPGSRAERFADLSSDVACAVDNFGPVDLTALPHLRRALSGLAGSGQQEQIDAVARAASPLFSIDERTKPIMVVQGDTDHLVPRAQSVALSDVLSEARVPSIYVGYPGGHSFKGLTADELKAILQLERAFIAAAHTPK